MPNFDFLSEKPNVRGIKEEVQASSSEFNNYKDRLAPFIGSQQQLIEKIRSSGIQVDDNFFSNNQQQDFVNSAEELSPTEILKIFDSFSSSLSGDFNTLNKYINTSNFKQLPTSTQNAFKDLSSKYNEHIKTINQTVTPIQNKVQEEKKETANKELSSDIQKIRQKENDFKVVDPVLETDSNNLLKTITGKELNKNFTLKKVQNLLEANKLEEAYKEYIRYQNQEKINRENLQQVLNSSQFSNLPPEEQQRFREYVRQTGELWNSKQDLFQKLTNNLKDLDSNIKDSVPDGSYSPSLFGKEGSLRQSESGVLYDKDNKIINTESWGIRFTACSSQESFLFELLPAINSVLPIQGSRDVPNAMAGLTFSIKPNIAKLRIAGFQPVYQHLGIDTVIVTIVGAFTGNEGYNTAPTDLDLAGSFHFKSFSDRKTEGVQLEQVLKTISRKEDSFKQFNRFYNLTARQEVEVEINTAKYDTFDIESDAKSGIDRKTDLDKDPPFGFRDKRTGNPKFKGFIKSMEASYVRNNRTYYVIQVEVSDFGLVNVTPPKLDYVPDTSNTAFETLNPNSSSGSTSDNLLIKDVSLNPGEYFIGDPKEIKNKNGNFKEYKICTLSNDQIIKAKEKNLFKDDKTLKRTTSLVANAPEVITTNCRTAYSNGLKELKSTEVYSEQLLQNLNLSETEKTFLNKVSPLLNEEQNYIPNTLQEKSLLNGQAILKAQVCTKKASSVSIDNFTNRLSAEEEQVFRDLKIAYYNCGSTNTQYKYYIKDTNGNIKSILEDSYNSLLSGSTPPSPPLVNLRPAPNPTPGPRPD